ncbi:MAG: redox-sensing transcriptional repressor Rex [Candidatus Omnitrophica bacterium]|nr:redox-sensing transcriptional repressor Rex [Candidatus Omnitrophota bacterium]
MYKKPIIRLSRYKNALYRFKSLGLVRIFSDNLADAVGATAVQVRKDFSFFGITGNKRGGYLIEDLLSKVNEILGKDKITKVIVVGAGHLGSALMNYKGFPQLGIQIAAGFDIDPVKINRKAPIPIFPLDELRDFIRTHTIKVAVIAVPDIAAQQVFNIMISEGITGIVNFAPLRLKTDKKCAVHNVNLGLELETIIYFANALEKENHEDGHFKS